MSLVRFTVGKGERRHHIDAWEVMRKEAFTRYVLTVTLAIASLLVLSPGALAQESVKRVLILTGSDPNHPGFSIVTRNIRSTLRDGSSARIEMLYELQDELISPPLSPRREQELAAYLKQKYDAQNVDLILVLAAPRFRLLVEKDPTLFAHVPKVFYDFDSEREAINRSLGPNITAVWANLNFYKTLELALALRPGTHRVVVISGFSATDQVLRETAQAQFRPYESRLEFSYVTGETVDELKARLSALPEDSVAVFLGLSRDRLGRVYSAPEALSRIAPASSVPIYGISDTLIGLGITGGNLLDFDAIGNRIGQIGLRVLAGEKPEKIPQETAPTVTTVDWRELQRFGISDQNLPPGSVVRFRQSTTWELYSSYIIALVAAVIAEALLIAWLLVLRSRRRQAENEKVRLAELAQTQHKRLDEVVSNVPGIVWETAIDPETKERKTTFISDYLEQMVGYTPDEWLAESPGFGMKLMLEEDREQAMRDTNQVIATGKGGLSHFRWKAKDGRIVWTETHLCAITDEQRRVVGLRGVTLDITDRKQARELLLRAEEKDRAILGALPDLMFVQSADGVYLDYHANNPADLMVPPQQFLGKNIKDVMPPQLAGEFLDSFQRASENGPQIVEYMLTMDNRQRWFEARIIRAGDNILSIVRDITERKHANDELRQSEDRFVKVFQANPQPMSVTTVATGLHIDVNPSYLALTGYTRDELNEKTSLELGVWETEEERAAFIQRLREQGSIVNLESKIRTKSGAVRLLLSSVELLEIEGVECLLVTATDMTERILAQQALQESEERFRNMAENAPLIIWMTGIDKKCTYLNQNWLDFTGRTEEEVLGYGWAKDMHPDDYQRCIDVYEASFERQEAFTVEYRLRNVSGHYHWIFGSGTPRFSATGEFLGYIGTCLDITARKEVEESLRAAHAEVSRLKNQLQEDNIYLQQEIKLEQNFDEIIGKSDELKSVLFKIEQVAPTDSTVLITGETGTGKELIARAIHNASARKDRPLIKLNCAALSASLIESELFGHEKGAFTGAVSRKVGRFELADGATIFLDEIGELPMELQVKLLRVIQEGEFERIGSSKTIKVDVRIIAATNRNLHKAVSEGRFREDLWYRLNVFPIMMPPLRARKHDIPLLVEHFVRRFSKAMGKKVTSVSPSTLKALSEYSWPGNIRELGNVVERGVINSRGSVLQITDQLETVAVEQSEAPKTLEEMERDYITRILEQRGWRIEGRNGAARLLGINPSTLRTRMIKLGIQKPQSFTANSYSN